MLKVIGQGEKECYINLTENEFETLKDRFEVIPCFFDDKRLKPFKSQAPWCLRVAPLTKEEKKKGKK